MNMGVGVSIGGMRLVVVMLILLLKMVVLLVLPTAMIYLVLIWILKGKKVNRFVLGIVAIIAPDLIVVFWGVSLVGGFVGWLAQGSPMVFLGLVVVRILGVVLVELGVQLFIRQRRLFWVLAIIVTMLLSIAIGMNWYYDKAHQEVKKGLEENFDIRYL